MDLIDIYRIFYLIIIEYIFYVLVYGILFKINYMIGYKISINEFKKIEIILIIFLL